MSESGSRDFTLFFNEKLRPVIEGVVADRRRALKLSVYAALGAFAVFFVAVYLFFSPYRKMLGDFDITYWPLLIMLPATMAVICFSLVYILMLRSMVKDFREALVGRLAGFIDPGFTHDSANPVSVQDMRDSLLFDALGGPVPGRDVFRGRAGDAAVEIAEAAVSGDPARSGLFLSSRLGRKFASLALLVPEGEPVSIGATTARLADMGAAPNGGLVRHGGVGGGWQALAPSGDDGTAELLLSPEMAAKLGRMRLERGVDFFLSFQGDRLWMAMLAKRGRPKDEGVIDGFDFANCREFCHEADLCLDLLRELQTREALWA